MPGRSLRWGRHLLPAIAGAMSFACFSAHAQHIANANLLNPTAMDTSLFLEDRSDSTALPDAPLPQSNIQTSIQTDIQTSSSAAIPQQEKKSTEPGFPPVSPPPSQLPRARGQHPGIPSQPRPCQTDISTVQPHDITCAPKIDYFQRFVDSGTHPLTPHQKFILAYRNLTDPYNFATIAGVSAISVASDPSSPYGPGFPGFGRNFGVAYCETTVSEFFGTFLIPSIAHQDPHYHRMPNASYVRRALHAITAVGVAQSDYGDPMPNYANLVGSAASISLSNIYVPGRQTNLGSTASRYLTGLATDPIDNFISEFLPDVARHVNVHIVLVQRVIDQVERQNGTAP